jgi:hypothetical protein
LPRTGCPGKLKNLNDLKRGEPLTPRQYVVHDVDDLGVPISRSARLASPWFSRAGGTAACRDSSVRRGVAAPYLGDWPGLEPFRLVLETAPGYGQGRGGHHHRHAARNRAQHAAVEHHEKADSQLLGL